MANANKPGDGIRSMRSTNAFRVLNFELYAKPNKIIMAVGMVAFGCCCGYVLYMRQKYRSMGYTPVIHDNGEEFYIKKISRWEK